MKNSTSALHALTPLAIMGDSIASGYLVERGWVEHLGDEVGAENITNFSYPGATIAALTERVLDDLIEADPHTVVIASGLNDLAGIGGIVRSAEEVAALLTGLAEVLAARGMQVLVCTPHWLDAERALEEFGMRVDPAQIERLRERLTAYGQSSEPTLSAQEVALFESPLSERGSITVLDMYGALAGRSDLLLDGVHPDQEGHQLIEEYFVNTVVMARGKMILTWDYSVEPLVYEAVRDERGAHGSAGDVLRSVLGADFMKGEDVTATQPGEAAETDGESADFSKGRLLDYGFVSAGMSDGLRSAMKRWCLAMNELALDQEVQNDTGRGAAIRELDEELDVLLERCIAEGLPMVAIPAVERWWLSNT